MALCHIGITEGVGELDDTDLMNLYLMSLNKMQGNCMNNQNGKLPNLLSDVILNCVSAVKNGNPFDACPWIIIEEILGTKNRRTILSI